MNHVHVAAVKNINIAMGINSHGKGVYKNGYAGNKTDDGKVESTDFRF